SPPCPPLFPYTTLFRSGCSRTLTLMAVSFAVVRGGVSSPRGPRALPVLRSCLRGLRCRFRRQRAAPPLRHAVALMPKWARNAREIGRAQSELQSPYDLV